MIWGVVLHGGIVAMLLEVLHGIAEQIGHVVGQIARSGPGFRVSVQTASHHLCIQRQRLCVCVHTHRCT